jgi:2'-5' RNA ligase
MTQVLRTFLAIELPDSTKNKIFDFIQPHRDLTKSLIRWVNWENLHITLKFLGEFDQTHVHQLNNLLTNCLNVIPVFKIHFDRIGAFPNLQKPKVVWLGFDYPENLHLIYRHIEENILKLGYEGDDRPFSPHLTLGRVRRYLSKSEIKNVGQIMSSVEFNFQSEFMVEKITFFQSDLTREGPIYTKLFETNLVSNPSLC